MVDCYTGSDTGVIFLSEAAVVNLSDTLQRRLKRLAQVLIEIYLFTDKHVAICYNIQSQVKGVVLLEQTPTSGQYLIEVQEQLTIELGLTCIPVKSPAHAAKMIKTMVNHPIAYYVICVLAYT